MDEILETINPFGRYQKLSLLLIGLTSILVAMPVYSSIFILARPDFKCSYKNSTESFFNSSQTCKLWSNISNNNNNYECKYDSRHYGLTVVNEWNLICDRQFLGGIPQTIYMLGTFSCFGIGFFSDKFGRRSIMLALTIFLCFNLTISELFQLSYLKLSITTRFIIFSISNFLTGCTVASIYSVSIVVSLELTTKKYSTIASNIGLYMYVLGEIFVLIIAYFLRNWHYINIINAIFSIIVTLLIYAFLQESPRYLEQQKKYHETFLILKKIALINGKQDKLVDEADVVEQLLKKNNIESSSDCKETNDSLLENKNNNERKSFDNTILSYVFSSQKNLLQICLLLYIWFAIQLTYFGMSLGITAVGQGTINPYLMFIMSSFAEIIGYLACHMNDKYGRKKMLFLFLALSSIVLLAVALIPVDKEFDSSKKFLSFNSMIIILMATFGKASVSAAYSSLFIYTCQLFPTKIRNTLLLFVSSIGRIGSIISPLINQLSDLVWQPIPYIIFSSGSFIACTFVLILTDPAKSNYF